MTPEEYFEGRLAEFKAEWEGGKFSAIIEAFRECAIGGYPIPEWLALVIDDELCWSFDNRPTGRGSTGNRFAAQREANKHQIRADIYAMFIAYQEDEIRRGVRSAINKAQALRETSRLLKNSFAWGTAEAIRDSLKSLNIG